MFIQLPVRWTTPKIDHETIEEMQHRQNLGLPADMKEAVDIELTDNFIVLDTKDIRAFHAFDDTTILRTTSNETYCIRIPFEDFKQIFVKLTSQQITEITPVGEGMKKNAPSPQGEDMPLDLSQFNIRTSRDTKG